MRIAYKSRGDPNKNSNGAPDLSQLTQTLGERIHLTSCKLLSQSAAGTATPQALALTPASAANYRVLRWIPLQGSKR